MLLLKTITKNCVYSCIGIFIASICVEMILRIVTPFSQPLRFYTQYSKKVSNDYRADIKGCQLQPNSVLNGFIINSRGDYSPEYPFTKPENTKRIVAIGDSALTAVVPYPNGFLRIVEKQLPEKIHLPIQIVNLGIPCIGPLAEKEILQEKGSKYEPDVVLLVFTISNDFTDDQTYINAEQEQIKQESLIQKIIRESYLASFLKTRYFLSRSTVQNQSSTKEKNALPGTYIGTEYDPTIPSFPETDYVNLTSSLANILLPNALPRTQIQAVQQRILDMKLFSDKLNAKFVVLLIPAEFQVNRELLASASAVMSRHLSDFDIVAPQNMLKSFFDQHQIQYIDVLSNWKDVPNAQNYYHPQDTHLNIEGNQSVAEILYPKIFELLQNK